MDYRILGPLEVSAGNGPLELGGRRQRTVLAALLLNANQVTPTDQLVDVVWGEEPPPTARRSIQAYVSRLRKVLGDDRVVPVAPGYLIKIDEGELDADRFEALTLHARSIGSAASTARNSTNSTSNVELNSTWPSAAPAIISVR